MSRINRSNIDEILNLDTTKDNNIVSDSLVKSSENSTSVVRFNNQTIRRNSSENSHGYSLFWRFNLIWLICFVICMCFIATFLLLTHYWQDFLKDKFSRSIKFSSEKRNWDKKADQFCKTSILEWSNLVIQKKPFDIQQSGKICGFVNFINQELKFCKIAQLFSWEENLRERENFFQKIQAYFNAHKRQEGIKLKM